MKLRVIYGTWFVPPGSLAWVLFPFMLFRQKKADVTDSLFRHELEHVYQVKRDGWFKFYFGYMWDWLTNGFNYYKIRYEVEARARQSDPLNSVERYWKDGNNST